jgi:hypothetical protein
MLLSEASEPERIYERYTQKLKSANPCVKLYLALLRSFVSPVQIVQDK